MFNDAVLTGCHTWARCSRRRRSSVVNFFSVRGPSGTSAVAFGPKRPPAQAATNTVDITITVSAERITTTLNQLLGPRQRTNSPHHAKHAWRGPRHVQPDREGVATGRPSSKNQYRPIEI